MQVAMHLRQEGGHAGNDAEVRGLRDIGHITINTR
jgi:hypothetical protein